jgi:hypothetical protein
MAKNKKAQNKTKTDDQGRTPDDYWYEDPDYPVSDWQYAVATDDTRLGYKAWIEHEKELKAELDEQELEEETGEPCEECGNVIPFSATADGTINKFHDVSCSLHPDNSINT